MEVYRHLPPERAEAVIKYQQRIQDIIAGRAIAATMSEKPMPNIGHDEEYDS